MQDGGTVREAAPLIAHVIYRLDVGGLENGLVNLINGLPAGRYRHAIICLKDYTDFRLRIHAPGVQYFALNKQEGKDPALYFRLWRLLRRLRPDLVHTRNLTALEAQLPAALAGVRCRIHSEHGRDVHDLDGTNPRYRRLRRLFRPLVDRYIALSQDLERYLRDPIAVSPDKLVQIYNGVDSTRFYPRTGAQRPTLEGLPFSDDGLLLIGTIGRMETVKDQLTLVRAFLQVLEMQPEACRYLRLVLIGDGTQREQALSLLREAKAESLAWLPGARDDVADVLRCLDLFVLPSLAEGISNTILEAMASGLPVIATRVGGNAELVQEGVTGLLVPPSDPKAMAEAIGTYLQQPDLFKRHGAAGRERVEREFSLQRMLRQYEEVYDQVLKEKGRL